MSTDLALIQIRSVPAAMKALELLELDINQSPSAEVLQALANVSAGLQRRWKPVKEVAGRAGRCWIAAEVKLGEEKKKLGKAVGTRGQIKGSKEGSGRGKGRGKGISSGDAIVESPEEDIPTNDELGLDPKQAARAEMLFELGEDERQSLITELEAKNKPVTPHGLLAAKRARNKTEKKHQIATAVFSEEGPFDVAIIDPPWPMQKIDRDARPNQDAFDYPTMTPEELLAFWNAEVVTAGKLQDDCHLFVWTTQKFLPATFSFVESIGFRYVLEMVWHKPGGFQPIGLPQYNCEFVLYARKGQPVFIDTKDFFCCFTAPRREHSRKPDFFYDMIRRENSDLVILKALDLRVGCRVRQSKYERTFPNDITFRCWRSRRFRRLFGGFDYSADADVDRFVDFARKLGLKRVGYKSNPDKSQRLRSLRHTRVRQGNAGYYYTIQSAG